MWQDLSTFFDRYSPVGDFTVLGVCLCFMFLITVSYIKRTHTFHLYKVTLATIVAATICRLVSYKLLERLFLGRNVGVMLIGVFRMLFYLLIFAVLYLFMVYMTEALHIDRRIAKHHLRFAAIFFFAVAAYAIYDWICLFQIRKMTDGRIYLFENNVAYIFIYLFFMLVQVWQIYYYRKRIFKQILYGIALSCAISTFFVVMQFTNQTVSFTMVSFIFPLFTILYMVHSNPYDIEIGTVDNKAFQTLIEECNRLHNGLVLVQIYFPKLEKSTLDYPDNLRRDIRGLFSTYFRHITAFQITPGRVVLTADYAKNTDLEQNMEHFFRESSALLEKEDMTFKSLGLITDQVYSKSSDYLGLFKYCGSSMPDNSCCLIKQEEETEYFERQELIRELEDICSVSDPADERVLLYLQPVYNTETGKYDTAEALMRLKGKDGGVLQPDQFIPLAEKHGFIHELGMILLHKTCKLLKELRDHDCPIRRVSVNFVISDLRNEDFCEKILSIIKESGLSEESIAIEMTETQNESDFLILQQNMNKLKDYGIKFYLDDFGTGYSNYERIMELPFDIIKFDRSLVNACLTNKKSETMVQNIAGMFHNMGFAILYEGVETEENIEKCTKMQGKYLQGFYYSNPIPAEEVEAFLRKNYDAQRNLGGLNVDF